MRRATAAEQRLDIFERNRAVGRIVLSVDAASGASRRGHLYEEGSLRLRFPNSDVAGLEAMIVNTAGGMVGGDCFDLDVSVERGGRLVVTTAAAEKIYRSLGPETTIEVKLDIGADAALSWLPQETILFDRARLARSLDVDLAATSSLILVEAIVFGRSAMGEAVREDRLLDRWRVRRGGRLIFAETVRLEGAIAKRLAEPAIASGAVALATVLVVPGGESQAAAVRGLGNRLQGDVGISSWNGLAVARLCARDGAMLRRDLITVVTALGNRPLPRLWLN